MLKMARLTVILSISNEYHKGNYDTCWCFPSDFKKNHCLNLVFPSDLKTNHCLNLVSKCYIVYNIKHHIFLILLTLNKTVYMNISPYLKEYLLIS